MCNDYRLTVDAASIAKDLSDLKIKIRFGEGIPNLQAREDIKITDVGPIVRSIDGVRDEAELVQRRWSWPGPNKRPVYNFRSEGREFTSNRCLIIADGFYEFTEPNRRSLKRNARTSGCSRKRTSRSSASRAPGAKRRRWGRHSPC